MTAKVARQENTIEAFGFEVEFALALEKITPGNPFSKSFVLTCIGIYKITYTKATIA